MTDLELQSSEFASHKFLNSANDKIYAAGELVEIDGRIGVVVENVGPHGQEKNTNISKWRYRRDRLPRGENHFTKNQRVRILQRG